MKLPDGVKLLRRDYIQTDDDKFLRIQAEYNGQKEWFARGVVWSTEARAEEWIVNKMKEVWKL